MDRARSVVGVDLDDAAIQHAKENYGRAGLEFRQGSATSIPLPDNTVDLAISYETIEHLDEHQQMLAELKRVLRPDGVLLISSPNKAVYSDKGEYANPFHKKELYTDEFKTLVGNYFAHTVHYGQKTTAASVIASESEISPLLIYSTAGTSTSLLENRYDLILASNKPLPELPNSLFEILESPLQPESAEIALKHLGVEQTKLQEANAHLHNEFMRLQEQNSYLLGQKEQAELKYQHVYNVLGDASNVVNDKWWRRTRWLRKVSNSIRKRRGKAKKVWREWFDLSVYPSAPARTPLITSIQQRCRPHITVISMARNEAARADDTMRHFCALFDRVIVLDHLSEDSTASIVARYDGHDGTDVLLLRGEDEGYYQSEYMTAVANAVLAEGRSDWIFFIDFDEFLPFRSASEFRQALVPLAGADVIHSHWTNLALTKFGQGSLQGAEAEVAPIVSEYVKIALNVPQLAGRRLTVEQGNHAVIFDGQTSPCIGERAFGLLHVPIYNEEVFQRKIEQGARAYDATVGKDKSQGTHWRDMYREAKRLKSNSKLSREIALSYGAPLANIISAVENGVVTTNTRTIKLDFAQTVPAEIKAGITSRAEIASFNLGTIKRVLAERLPPAAKKGPQMGSSALPNAIYETLPSRTVRLAPSRREDRVRRAMLSAVNEIEVIVPTAWSGHKPFLFSLMEIMRPQRFVELGTHAGASYFAACQHIKANGNYGEAVAIDLWEGDHQAGFYDETVFENFKSLLQKHYPNGRYIRSYFHDAVKAFEPNSIDLLHIDGLHTYDAVKEDYVTWKSKVSPNGIIIFHDTSEYQTDFGVWQLFNEVRSEATASFCFQHCHGLGVMAFGDPELNPAIELLQHFNREPEIVENYYAILGDAMFQSARMKLHGLV